MSKLAKFKYRLISKVHIPKNLINLYSSKHIPVFDFFINDYLIIWKQFHLTCKPKWFTSKLSQPTEMSHITDNNYHYNVISLLRKGIGSEKIKMKAL